MHSLSLIRCILYYFIWISSLTVHNLYVEDKVGVSWDSWLRWTTICAGSWATNISLFTNSKVDNCILPALHNSHLTNNEGDWLSSWDRWIEDFTVSSKSSGILNLGSLSGLALSSSTLFKDVHGDTSIKFLFSKILRSRIGRSISFSGSSSSSSGASLSRNLGLSLGLSFGLSLSEHSWINTSSGSCSLIGYSLSSTGITTFSR